MESPEAKTSPIMIVDLTQPSENINEQTSSSKEQSINNFVSKDTVIPADEVHQSEDVPITITADEEECSGDLVLSHQEVMIKVQSTVSDIIATDPLLYDLPPQVTLEEINSYIALEHGKAMVVNVRRADNEILPIVVTQDASVLDLKHAIKRHINLKQEREGGNIHISWRYVWKHYWLYYDNVKLSEDKKLLKDYGIRNKEQVTFIKRLKERGRQKR